MALTDGQQPLYACTNNQQNLAPGTLPDGTEPLIFLDFKNGVYTDDEGPTTLGALVVENLDYGTWDEAWVTPNVGVQHAASMTLTGEALSLVLAGSTMLYTFQIVAAESNAAMRVEMIDWPDFNTYYMARVRGIPEGGDLGVGEDAYYDYLDALPIGPHKAAVTMIDGKLARSIDGLATYAVNPAAPWTVAPNFLGINTASTNVILESIGLYPPQDDAGLPTLSAP